MASPGELVKCVAEVLHLPEQTVTLYDRQLAENGLRSRGGRGKSAAKVTATDAANLLIAILGSPVSGAAISSAALTCDTYGNLPLKLGGDLENRNIFAELGFPTLAKMGRIANLRSAVTALIEGAIKGEQLKIPNDEEPNAPIEGPDTYWHTQITLDGPTPWAQITADGSIGQPDAGHFARLVFHDGKRTATGTWRKSPYRGDLHQSRYVSFRTIAPLASLLRRIGR